MVSKIARQLRTNLTEAEQRLWSRLRRRQLGGCYFRRQAPIGDYIVDFACFERNLVVEVDGGQHTERVAQDTKRSEWLDSQGYRVLRFWNNDVLQNVDGVVDTILAALREP